eukprot:595088-Hanusia_phi.AAC.2
MLMPKTGSFWKLEASKNVRRGRGGEERGSGRRRRRAGGGGGGGIDVALPQRLLQGCKDSTCQDCTEVTALKDLPGRASAPLRSLRVSSSKLVRVCRSSSARPSGVPPSYRARTGGEEMGAAPAAGGN